MEAFVGNHLVTQSIPAIKQDPGLPVVLKSCPCKTLNIDMTEPRVYDFLDFLVVIEHAHDKPDIVDRNVM